MASKPDYRIEYTMRYENADGTFNTETHVNSRCKTKADFEKALQFYASHRNCIFFKALGKK